MGSVMNVRLKNARNITYYSFITGFALLFMVLTGNAQTESYTWNNVAIGGGGYISGIITSKKEKNLMYARTDVGGAYRWNSAENKWIPLLDWVSEDQIGFLGVESIAIDPVETSKVYMLVGTSYFNGGKTAILRSSDYGNTFTIVDVTSQFKAHGNGMGRQTGEKLQVDANSNNILFCGTRANGLFKSADSGATWNQLSGLPVTTTTTGNGISLVVLDPSSATSGNPTQTIIAGVSQIGTNLYRSDDGGETFSPIVGAPTTLMPHRATLASDRNLYITYDNAAGPWDISGSGQIWKYNLGNGSWTNITPAGFSNNGFGGISVDPNNASRLMASTINSYTYQDNAYGDKFFLSTNGGTTWTDVIAGSGRSFKVDSNGISWIAGNGIHWTGCVEFDPFNTKRAWVTSGNGVFSTDDIDALSGTWKFADHGLEETVPLDLVSIPNGPLVSAIGDYDGFRHTDVTMFAPIHTPRVGTTTSIAYAIQNPNIMLRVGQKTVNGTPVGVLYRSADMGITWTECTSKGPSGNVGLSADGSVFFHCPNNSTTTYRSTDNGASWTAINGLTINTAKLVTDPVNPKKIYAYDNNGTITISTDTGVTFSNAGSAGTGGSKIIRLAPDREGDLWVALRGNGLTRSTNSGSTFTKVNGVSSCEAVGFGKPAPGKSFPSLYICGTVNNVWGIHRSIDEGVTWTRINDDDHQYGGPGNGQFVLGDMNVYGRVYMSTAGRGIVYGESDQTCTPTLVIPHIKVNADASQQTNTLSLATGDKVVLSPDPIGGGVWKWSGPNGFVATDREITLSSLQTSQAGTYTVHYTNVNGCESAPLNFIINVHEVKYILTTAASPLAGGTVSGAGTYTSGTNVALMATPAAGYTFTGWSGDASGTNASVTITMNSNKTVTANFQAIKYTLTTTASPAAGGTVSGAGTYTSGTNVALTATPAAGYTFTGWSGDASGTNASVTITMNSNKTVTANFQLQSTPTKYTMTTIASPSDGGSLSGAGTYDAGSTATLTATPAAGYIFTGWSGDATGTDASIAVTMSSNKTVTANFSVITFTLSATVVPVDGGSVTGQGTYPSGTEVAIDAVAAAGYTFIGWSGDIAGTITSQTVTMTNDVAVQANFQKNEDVVLKIPKLFSPDNHGDLSTEAWNIENAQLLDGCEIVIYNRQGQKVYSSTGYSYPWDGTSNGRPLPDGAYFYLIRYPDNTKQTGSVTIARLK